MDNTCLMQRLVDANGAKLAPSVRAGPDVTKGQSLCHIPTGAEKGGPVYHMARRGAEKVRLVYRPPRQHAEKCLPVYHVQGKPAEKVRLVYRNTLGSAVKRRPGDRLLTRAG